MSSESQGVNNFSPFKQFEHILRNKFETFPKKIQSLIAIWKSLGQCKEQNCDIGYIIQIMDWAKLHTLNIVLTASWKKFKANYEAKLLTEVEQTQNELCKISDVFSKKFQKLSDVIKNPWDDPILANLLHDSNASIGPDEIEFFCIETAYLVSVRLKKLCESRCEDLALNLVTAFMSCYDLSVKQKFNLNATKTHILFCFDVHVALLYRYKRNSEIVEMFKKLSFEEGLQLIRRFTKKRVKISKVWRNYPEITFFASQVFVTAAVTKPFNESGKILRDLLETWIAFSEEHTLLEQMETSIRKIIQAATAAQHIYICCEIIHNKLGAKLKTFTIELYIRALTTDMNNLESQKSEGEKEKIEETTKRLADGFSNLADILKDNIQVSRECALTAFSLDPTLERLKKIEDLARLSGINVLDTGQIWECKLHPPVTTADEICWVCNVCGKWMCKPNLDLHLGTNFALNEALNFETLGISSQLCDDLAVVLNGPRYHLLSWLLRWEDLHRLCEMYLNDLERTKNLVTELKFVEIDYSMFATIKREPVDENSGIEKGYEKFLYPEEKFVDFMDNSNPEPEPLEIPQTKSDPNTLKTLRMFRHNIKRNRSQFSQNITGSNNFNSGIGNHTRESNSFPGPPFNFGFNFNQQFHSHPFTHAVFNQNSHNPRSFTNTLLDRVNSHYKNSPEGPVDFSSSSSRLSDQPNRNGTNSDARDFRINIQKRKQAESIDKNRFEQNFPNFVNSDDNFLHNMISYEFARTSTDTKRSRPSDYLNASQSLISNKAPNQKHNFLSLHGTENVQNALNYIKHDRGASTNTDKMQAHKQSVPKQSTTSKQYSGTSERLQFSTGDFKNHSSDGNKTLSSDIINLTKNNAIHFSKESTKNSHNSGSRNDQNPANNLKNVASRNEPKTVKNLVATYSKKIQSSVASRTDQQAVKDPQSLIGTHKLPPKTVLSAVVSRSDSETAKSGLVLNHSVKQSTSSITSKSEPEIPKSLAHLPTQLSKTLQALVASKNDLEVIRNSQSTKQQPKNFLNATASNNEQQTVKNSQMPSGPATIQNLPASGNNQQTKNPPSSATSKSTKSSTKNPQKPAASNSKKQTSKNTAVISKSGQQAVKNIGAPRNNHKFSEPTPNLTTYGKMPSQTKELTRADIITSSINYVKDFTDKEHETISPSKGFPSFDKIPPPPQTKPKVAKESPVEPAELLPKPINSVFASNSQKTTAEIGVQATCTSDQQNSITKNENHFLSFTTGAINDKSVQVNLKRSNDDRCVPVVPPKKHKLEEKVVSNEQKLSRPKNGITAELEELSKNKIIKALLEKGNTEKTDASIQNENSSKNANCCLPTNDKKADCCKRLVIDSKTPIIPSGNNNNTKNQKNVPQVDASCCKTQQCSKQDGVGKADNKTEIGAPLKTYSKEKSHNKSLLLKTLSEQHIPLIVEKELNETKTSVTKTCIVKLDDLERNSGQDKAKEDPPPEKADSKIAKNENVVVQNENNNSLFRFDNKPIPNNRKELKIIIHRLSNEVIKSFIPSYSDSASRSCNCRTFENKPVKRPIGRPRKVMCCKYKCSKNPGSSHNRIFDRVNYGKDSLAMPGPQNGDLSNGISSRISNSPQQDSSDIDKKTGSNKNFKNNDRPKKIVDIDNQKRDDSDKLKKPKKDFSDKDKKGGDRNSKMNPRVILERLPLDSNYVRSVLSNVPGLNDYEMIRPSNVNHIVNVVQISGGRATTTVPVQNTQTSTQITPHIQRIGQPRSDKPEHNANSETATTATPASTSTSIKPSTSQPSTLINILSQQIIRPGQSNCVRNRSSPLINILSQQIIRPATTQINKVATNSSSETQSNNNPPKVTSSAEQLNQNEAKPATTTAKTATNTPGGQGTILQFICKSTLPKFQQAFGKSVYQNNTETTDATSTCTETTTSTDLNKKTPTKNSSVNIQPIQGGVIYTRQMPVGQTINLIPPGRGQVFRIATSNADQISLVKDTVIHSKMSALLAAALQGKQKTSESQSDGEATNEDASGTRVTVTRPTLVQNARIVKPVLQIPSNVIRTSPQSNLSSTTLEQLREFDMVYKQIKERSSTSTPSEPNTSEPNETSQRISVTYLNQGQKYTQLSPVVVVSSYCNLQPAASPALSVTSQGSSSPCVTPAPTPSAPKVSSKSSKGKTVKNTTTQASKASPIPKPQQKPQEDEHTTQRIFDILAEYAEQLRNSPDLNNKPAPRRRSNPPTNPSQNSKRKKSSSSKKSGQCSSMVSEADMEDHRTVGSEDSSCGVVQISVQEEEQPHMQTVTTESNDSSSGSRQQLILTDASSNQTRNLIIADSSVGEALKMPNTAVLVPGNYIMPVSMVKGGQQIAVVSGGSKILATVPARSGPNMLLFQSFLNQNRNKPGVPTVKYSTIQPISGISSQSLAGVSGQPPVILPPNSHNLTAVTLGQPLTLKKIDETDRVNTELLLTISQPRDNGNSSTESSTHPDSTNTITSNVGNIELEDTIIHSDSSSDKVFHTYQKSIDTTPIATPVIAQTSCVKEEPLDDQNNTSNSMTLNISSENKNESTKSLERVQSVLVTACTSNGPMLSHTPPRYRKPSESAGTNNEPPSNKEEFLHNGEKQNNNEQKQFQGNTTYYQNKNKKNSNPQRLDRELHQLCLQRKQAALERELRLQKSLSEECEDLGVDEPSTSDLFPEADILFDSNHSPSFDQSSQDLVKRPLPHDMKDENKSAMTLFSDDDNSSSLRTDFLFESVEYQTAGTELEYDQNQQLTNGQSSASNESGSSCEDHTLLQNCASMSDVTLNSPVSPDPYHENTPPSLNKYKFKYSNRRKGERHKQPSDTWAAEVSSSEDTTGSTELGKSSSHSPESCTNKRSHSVSCDDELSDGSYKVVRVAISKSDLLKDDESCEELHCEDDLDCSPSGRGARRSVKKMCCCCNGSQDGGVSRKRPSSRPHTPAPHKKAFLNKKR